MLPEISPATADALRTALDRADYRTDGVQVLLGREAHAALGRGEPEPAFRATADGGPLGVLVRMLLLGSVEPDAAVVAALAPLAPADAAAASAGASGASAAATAASGSTDPSSSIRTSTPSAPPSAVARNAGSGSPRPSAACASRPSNPRTPSVW